MEENKSNEEKILKQLEAINERMKSINSIAIFWTTIIILYFLFGFIGPTILYG